MQGWEELFSYVLSHCSIVAVIMGVLVFAFTYLLKLPIKHFTNKITNPKTKKLVNKFIIMIPYLLAFGTTYLFKAFNIDLLDDTTTVLAGSLAIVLYNVIDGVNFSKTNKEEKELQEAVKDVVDQATSNTTSMTDDEAFRALCNTLKGSDNKK